MQKNKINSIYKKHIKSTIKFGFLIIFLLILLSLVVENIFSRKFYAKKYGEKIIATVTSIEENKGKTRSNNSIIRVFISYKYNSKDYSNILHEYPKNVRIGDEFDIYVLDNNPENIVLYNPSDSIAPIFFIPLILISFIIIIYNIYKIFSELKLYNKSDNFDEIDVTFVSVCKKSNLLSPVHHFFILCESSELNMKFYSHYYLHDPSDFINEKEIKKFKVKFNRTNPKQYIMDVNVVDKYMLE